MLRRRLSGFVSAMRLSRPVLAVLLVAAAILIARLVPHSHPAAVAAPPVPVASGAATTPRASPTPSPAASASPSVAPSPRPSPRPSLTPERAAERFVTAWLNTSGGKQAWLDRLRPITDGQLLDGFSLTDTATVPRGRVQPGAHTQGAASADYAIVIVPTTAGSMEVDEASRDGAWVATSIAQAVQ